MVCLAGRLRNCAGLTTRLLKQREDWGISPMRNPAQRQTVGMVTNQLRSSSKLTLPANAAHGLRRSLADKQRAIEVCVKEFPELTQAKIAEMVGCSQRYVGMVKDGLNRNTSIEIPASRLNSRQTRRKPTDVHSYAPASPRPCNASWALFRRNKKPACIPA